MMEISFLFSLSLLGWAKVLGACRSRLLLCLFSLAPQALQPRLSCVKTLTSFCLFPFPVFAPAAWLASSWKTRSCDFSDLVLAAGTFV